MNTQIENEVTEFQSEVGILTIKSAEDFKIAGEHLIKAKKIQKSIDKFFDGNIKRLHASHKEAIVQKKAFLDPIKDGIQRVKNVMIQYEHIQESKAKALRIIEDNKKRKIAEDLKLEEAKALQDEGRKEEAEAVLETPVEIAPTPVEVTPKVKGVSFSTIWKFEIINEALIPREYCMPNLKAIGSTAKNMKNRTWIPGVRIYSEKVLSARTR